MGIDLGPVDALAHEGVGVTAILMSAILSIGVVLAFLAGQWGSLFGRPGVMADAMDRLLFLFVAGLLVAGAFQVSDILRVFMFKSVGADPGAMKDAIKTVAQVVVDILIVGASMLVTFGIAAGAIAGQFLTATGNASGLAEAVRRMATAILFGVLAILSIPIANILVAAIVRAM